jgi:hypothetical protein
LAITVSLSRAVWAVLYLVDGEHVVDVDLVDVPGLLRQLHQPAGGCVLRLAVPSRAGR